MCSILIFGGTTEGRELAQFCHRQGIPAYISVATEYGERLLDGSEYVKIITGRKDNAAIGDFLEAHTIHLVIDATHPYAREVSRNISQACQGSDVRYLRVLRQGGERVESGRYFDSLDQAVDYLNTTDTGRILVTTGSKELQKLCRLKDYGKRCVIRVLPADGIVEQCEALGFDRAQIIAEQGPFSKEQNERQLRAFNAACLLTKDSGRAGGFEDKVNAARECGAELLIIKRPEETGISLDEAMQILLTENSHE